jgi:hypothetical protein
VQFSAKVWKHNMHKMLQTLLAEDSAVTGSALDAMITKTLRPIASDRTRVATIGLRRASNQPWK